MKITTKSLEKFRGANLPNNVRVLPLLDKNDVLVLKVKLLNTWNQLREDYFPEMSNEDFDSQYLFHESVFMKCLAWRFASSDVFDLLKNKVLRLFSSSNDDDFCGEFVLHPIFYTRISKPQVLSDNLRNEAFLDSQPHYDRAFSIEAFSFWLALENTDEKTGGLCFFSDSKELNNLFDIPWGEKNKYSTNTYFENASKIDPFIKKALIPPNISAGSAYMFDSFVLHGATKALQNTRVSFDLRLIEKKVLDKLDINSHLIFQQFNRNSDFSNAMNLLYLGDFKGARELIPDIFALAKSKNINTPLEIDIRKIPKLFAWRSEYKWVTDNFHSLSSSN
jgi:hypothetical protein